MKKINWVLCSLVIINLGGCTSKNKQTGAPAETEAADRQTSSQTSGQAFLGQFDFARADRDQSGFLDLNEAQDQTGDAFDAADQDKNKVLSGGEVGRLSALDLDKNGSITILEALDATEKQFNAADSKKRGILDAKQSTQLSIAK